MFIFGKFNQASKFITYAKKCKSSSYLSRTGLANVSKSDMHFVSIAAIMSHLKRRIRHQVIDGGEICILGAEELFDTAP